MACNLLERFTDVLGEPEEICDSQPLSLSPDENSQRRRHHGNDSGSALSLQVATDFDPGPTQKNLRPSKGTGQRGEFRSADEIDVKYRNVFSYPFFNLVQSRVIDDALYSDKSMVVCAPTGSGKTVLFEMAIVHLLMQLEDKNETEDFKIIYMAPVKALCTERLTEWYAKFTKLGLLCIEVTGDTDVDFSQLQPYRIIITTPEKWDMLTRRWPHHRQLVEVIKLFLIDEVHILNDNTRGPVLETVVSRMKTIESSVQSTHRIEQLQQQYQGSESTSTIRAPNIRFIAVSATVGNPEDVAAWLGTQGQPAVYYKFGDECRPVKLKRVVEGYHCAEGSSIFKFDIILNYKLWAIIQKYHNGKPTLIFCNTRKSVALTAETLSREITITFNEEQKARLIALASTIKNKKLQTLVLNGVGCHHAGLLYEERMNIEQAFRNRELPILITTTTLAMGVNLPAHLVIIKNTQRYVNGAYQEYDISTILQMVGRAGRPQFDTEATAVIMTRSVDKPRYEALVGGSEPLQSYLHKRLPENLNSEAALGTVSDVAQCVQWLRSTFLSVRAAKDPKRYLGLPPKAPSNQISTKIEELCVKAMNGLATAGLITMDEACCIESTEAGRLMSIYYLDLETMKHIMKIDGSESLERLIWIVCECHELADMHLRMDERRCLNSLNRNNTGLTIRFPMKGKITTRQMKLNCVIQASLGCLAIPDPSLNQEATKVMRVADRVCKCLVAYVTRPALISQQPKYYSAILNSIILAKCVIATLWENSPYVSKQLRGIGPTFSTLLASAGKSNFMLLEESHPRDLERIMNKGPPAGNIIRKQISLLPKYQLTATPVDEKVVTIELKLLNHHNLAENMENLTAGPTHKSYIIIGDSENTLLLLTLFKEKDLISVYDGNITFNVTRKYGFEHKIYAHCISSTIAGIDANCEYVFKNIQPLIHQQPNSTNEDVVNDTSKRQPSITDTFRERKRKNTDNEITLSKEKKKRESSLFEKFKYLKQSFGKTSKVLKDDLEKSSVMSEKILQDLTHLEHPVRQNNATSKNITSEENCDNGFQSVKSILYEEPTTYEINNDDFTNDFIDDDKINNILSEIECEISKESKKSTPDRPKTFNHKNDSTQKPIYSNPSYIENIVNTNTYLIADNYKTKNNSKRIKNISKKSNFNFIDKLEKDIDLSDDEASKIKEQNGFSDAIRTHIEKYLLKTKSNVKTPDRLLKNLIGDEPLLKVDTIEKDGIITVEDSVIKKYASLDETLLLEPLDNETEYSLNHSVTKSINEASEINKRIKAIDTTINDMMIDCQSHVSNDEQELPIVILKKKNNKTEKSYDSNEQTNQNNEQTNNNNEQTNKNNEQTKNNNEQTNNNNEQTNNNKKEEERCEAYSLLKLQNDTVSLLIPRSNNTKHTPDIVINEPDVKIPKLLSEICKTSLFSSVERCIDAAEMNNSHKKGNSIFALVKTKLSSSLLKDNKENENIKLSKNIERKDNEHCDYTEMLPKVDVTAPIPRTSELKKKEVPVLELWKNYLKELTPLALEINEVNINNTHNNASENKTTSTEFEILSDSSNHSRQFHGVIENLRLSAINVNKDANTEAFKKIAPSSKNYCNNKVIRNNQTATQFGTEKLTNENFMRDITKHFAPPPTSDYLLQSLEHNNELILAIESNKIYKTDVLDTHRIKDYIEVDTCNDISNLDSQPLSNQQSFSKLRCVSSTVSRVINSDEQSNPQKLILLNDHKTKSGKRVTTQVNPLHFTQHSCDIKTLVPSTTEVLEKQKPVDYDLYNEWNDDITINKNATICAYSQKNNEHYSNDKSQTHYINQYSLSSNTTDLSTQETADHFVRVIRKLRIDLDVTEIISEADKRGNNKTEKIMDCSTELAIVPNLESFNLKENKRVHISSIEGVIEGPFEQESEPQHTICNQIKNDEKQDKDDNSDKYANEPLPISSVKAIELIESKLLEQDAIKEIEKRKYDNPIEEYNIEKTMLIKYQLNNVAVEKKPSSVESILQKYSNLMRQRNKETIAFSQSEVKEKCSVKMKKEKPYRPFKISDIHRLNPSLLPEILIEKPEAIQVTECFNQLNPDDKQAKLEEYKHFCEPLPMHNKMPKQEYTIFKEQMTQSEIDTMDDIPEYHPPYIDFIEEKVTVSDIDQTMFNPKALLQCFRKEDIFEPDDFIPPPPEFSDYLDETNRTRITIPTDCYETMMWEESVSHQENPNIGIFQEYQAELTPSKEIETWNEGLQIHSNPGASPYVLTAPSKAVETWNLSQENNAQGNMYASSGSSSHSFTITRKNEHDAKRIREKSVEQNQTLPRNIKLKAFKFIRRNNYL